MENTLQQNLIEIYGESNVEAHEVFGGWSIGVEFPNGYGASVICHSGSYGGDLGLWEIAVLRDGKLCYDTSITADVIGWLNDEQALDTVREISELPSPVVHSWMN